MNFTVTGTLLKKYDAKDVSPTFTKREFVLNITETNKSGVYTETPLFELTQERVRQVDGINVGDEITVHFGLKGRAWTNKETGVERYFTGVNAWKVEKTEATQQQENNDALNFDPNVPPQEEDDLPF